MTTITQVREEVETLAADIVTHAATGELGNLHDLERELWARRSPGGRHPNPTLYKWSTYPDARQVVDTYSGGRHLFR